MFKITESAKAFLLEQVEKEKQSEDETLLVRISMGIG
jgi:hypothetical protein